ncbi:MAG TPA: DNA N-6-adenine-methyltransferase [Elusimicrobiales bacterium]|nr:DNA N-6-adenine-methyltransferase [Elusimicrobiales bacterium]
MRTGFSQFDLTIGKDEWLTPKYITDVLGPFDLDPCASIVRPWDIGTTCYTKENGGGLIKDWHGFVWCNPPYGRETEKWMKRMAEHNNGIALIFARTETKTFFKWIWPKASGFFFIEKRVNFCDTQGVASKASAGAPSVLVAYGEEAARRLRECTLNGKYLDNRGRG